MGEDSEMNNTFCSKCHRIPSQCCCSPVKELTDEEINELYMEHGNKDWDWQIDFAKAILKKAQEK